MNEAGFTDTFILQNRAQLLGAQLNPLPALMLVVALRSPISTIGLLSVFGSFAQSALSSNPFGLSLIPLYLFGFIVHLYSRSLYHHHSGSRLALGAAAGAREEDGDNTEKGSDDRAVHDLCSSGGDETPASSRRPAAR